jgi:hypothetical protein
VKGIRGTIFVVVGNNNTIDCKIFFDFKIAELRDSEKNGNRYNIERNESLKIDAEIDIDDKNGMGDNDEAEIYYLIEFDYYEIGDEETDKYNVFALINKRGGGCDDDFGPGDAYRSEKENDEFADKSLENAIII